MGLKGEVPPRHWFELVNPAQNTVTGHDVHGQEIITGRLRRYIEPRRVGPPRSARDSILLSAPQLGEHVTLISQAARLTSKPRRELVDRTMGVIEEEPEAATVLFTNLATLSNQENVGNRKIVVEARRFEHDIRERMYERGMDIINPTAETEITGRELVLDMRDRFTHYRLLTNDEKLEHALSEARELLRDPEEVDRRFETFTLLQNFNVLTESGIVAQRDYENGLRHAVEHVLDNETIPYPTPVGMEHWVTRWANGTDVTADFVIRSLVQETTSREDITNVLYDMAVAGFSTGDPDVMTRTAELLSWQTDVMTWQSPQGKNHELARFDLDPDTRQKAREMHDAVLGYFSITSMSRQGAFTANAHRIYGDPEFSRIFAQQIIDHPDEMVAMGWDLSLVPGKGFAKLRTAGRVLKQLTEFGGDFMRGGLPAIYGTHNTEVGPLGEWLRDFYASISTESRARAPMSRQRSVLAHLNLPEQPSLAVEKITASEASHNVRDRLQITTFAGPIESTTYWNTLGYLVPDNLGRKEWVALHLQNSKLRKEMIEDQRHSLSPRGDHLEIVNSTLKDLGFDSIDFAMDPRQKDMTMVTVRVGNATFRCLLDRDYIFREVGSRHNLGLRQHAPFLELSILSHLYQIYCAEPNTKMPGQVEVGPPIDVVHRRAHRRVLPEGHHPRPTQIAMAWDEYGISIPTINQERQIRGETQMITWVSEVKPEHVIGKGPVSNWGGTASEVIRAVLN